jgi:guanylate kinase
MRKIIFVFLFLLISQIYTKMKKFINPRTLVICGPSGVGKGTLIEKLIKEFPDKVGLSVSHTSRPPRINEIDGVHYHFVSKDFLCNDIKSGEIKYLESAEVHSNIYGTRKDSVEAVHILNKVCILDVDIKGVQQIQSAKFPAKHLFIAPPTINSLLERLRNRGTESEEQIRLRVGNVKKLMEEILEHKVFDEILVNDKFDETYEKLKNKMFEWFPNVFIC